MVTRPIGMFAAIALLAMGVGLGLLCSRWFSSSRPADESIAVHDDSGGEVAAALTELRRAIDKLPVSVRDQIREELSATTARKPADSSATDVTRLTQAVELLDQLLAKAQLMTEEVRTRSRGLVESWKGPGFLSLDAMRLRINELGQGGSEHWGNDADEELTKAHLLWSREDVLDRYGPPNRVNTGHGIELVYDKFLFKVPGDPTETCWFVFDAQEGVITEVMFVCKDEH